MALDRGPGMERGGLSGYVFLDENGDGVRDGVEPPLEGVRVIAGGRTVRTDARGRWATWNLVPFESVRVHLDSLSIPDPRWVPARGPTEVAVPPSSYGRLDLPLVRFAELSGRVIRSTDEGERPLSRVTLELENLNTGTIRSFRTFSDGGFYAAGVTPGTYRLRVAPEALRAMDLVDREGPRRLTVEPGSRDAELEELLVRLVPADEPPVDRNEDESTR